MKQRVVTAAQMKAIEAAGNAHGLPYLQMMENAGLAACALMNRLRADGSFVLAVDLPSGIHTDTIEGTAHADLTVTFDSYKPLHFAPASAPLCGKVVCADIGILDE